MTLAQYMDALNLDDAEFAARLLERYQLGKSWVTASGVRKWRKGERLPSRTNLDRLYEFTNGLVTANDFTGKGPRPMVEAAE